MTEMTTDAATGWLFKIAARTPINIAPERQDRLAGEVFGSDEWTLQTSKEPATFVAVPEDRAIYASSAGQASLWCLAYASFQIMDVATRVRRGLGPNDQSVMDFQPALHALNIADYIEYSRCLFKVDKDWPSGLAKPEEDPVEGTDEWLVNNLYFGALSWILLHEIAHVHHDDQKYVPAASRIVQEYRADAFATTWILEDAGRGLHREFRVLAVVVALAWLFLNEVALGRGTTHPAAILRFKEAADQFDLGKRSVALESASYVLKAIFDPTSEPPTFNSSREAFDWVVGRLEVVFGA